MNPALPKPEQPVSLTQRAQTLIDLGRPGDALPLLHQALAQTPGDYEAFCLLSLAHWNRGDANEAVTWAERAIEAKPDGLWGHQLHACHLLNLGRAQAALTASLEAVRLSPENAKGLKILGRSQLAAGDVAASRETAARLREVAPESELTHEMFALIALRLKQWSEMELHCRRALAVQPNSFFALSHLGLALDKTTCSRGLIRDPGRLPEAIGSLASALQIDPSAEATRQSLTATLGRYLLCDWLVPPGGLALLILPASIVDAVSTASLPTFCVVLCLVGFALLGLAAAMARISLRRFAALPPSVQQVWVQHCRKTLGTSLPWQADRLMPPPGSKDIWGRKG